MKYDPKTRVYSYTRFSTPEQRRGTGRQRQDDAAVAWCNQHGLRLMTRYFDLGVSAFKGKNAATGELARFLKCVEDGRIPRGSILIVENLDRLSRQDVAQALQMFLAILNAGITIVTLIDGKVYTDRVEMVDLMLSLLIFARANDESRTKASRKAASWKIKRDRLRNGDRPSKLGRLPTWIRHTGTGFELIPERAAKLRTVFADYIAGLGVYRLSHKHDIPRGTVSYLLGSPNVAGDLIIRDGDVEETIPDFYPALLTRGQWAKVQHLRSQRFIARGHTRRGDVNLWAGLLVDRAGNRFDVGKIQGRRVLKAPGCTISADALDWAMLDHVLRQKLVRTRVEQDDKPSAKAQQVDRKLAKLQALLKGEDADVAATYLPMVRDLVAQRKQLAEQQKRVVTEEADFDLLVILDDGGTEAQRLEVRELIRETLDKIVVEASDGGAWAKLTRLAVHFHQQPHKPFRFTLVTARSRRGFVMLVGGEHGLSLMLPSTFRRPEAGTTPTLSARELTTMSPRLAQLARSVLPVVPVGQGAYSAYIRAAPARAAALKLVPLCRRRK